MKFFTRSNFAELCSFNCQAARLFGFFYFRAVRDGKRAESGHSESLRFLFYLVFGCVASLKSATLNVGDSTSSFILLVGIELLIKTSIFMPSVFRVFNYAVRRRHAKVIEDIQAIDDELKRLGAPVDYSRHFLVAFLVTTFYNAFMLVTFTVDTELSLAYLKFHELDALSAFFGAFNVAGYLNYQVTHMLLVASLYWRLKLVNRVLRQRLLCSQLVQRVGRLQTSIVDTLQLVNCCYTANVLNYAFQFVIFTVFFVFGLLDLCVSPRVTAQAFAFSVIQGFFFLFFLWFGLWLVTASSWIKSEGSETRSVIHSKSIVNPKSLRAANVLCLQLEHSRPIVSCGLFALDWTFLFTFISAVFSYIIILLQFDSDSSGASEPQ